MSERLYSFEELSPLAKDKALQDLRDADLFSPEDLTEMFKQDLEEIGLPTDKVYWSLGYTQGDGVSFYGPIDELPKFLKKHRLWTKYKDIEPYVSFRITGEESRFFGPGSMDIEYELLADEADFIPKKIWEEMKAWERGEEDRHRQWQEKVQRIRSRTGPKEWSPRIPDFVHKPSPKRFDLAHKRAKDRYNEVEQKAEDLREDIKEIVEQKARELARMGYDEIEYQNSDEYLIDGALANDWRFNEDGDWVR